MPIIYGWWGYPGSVGRLWALWSPLISNQNPLNHPDGIHQPKLRPTESSNGRSHMISLDFILYNPSKDRKVNPTEHLQFHILQHPGWDSQRQRQDAASLSQILNWKLTTWRVMKSDPRNGWKLKPETIGNRRQPQLFGGGHLWFPVKISLKPIISIAFHQIDKDLDSWQILTV